MQATNLASNITVLQAKAWRFGTSARRDWSLFPSFASMSAESLAHNSHQTRTPRLTWSCVACPSRHVTTRSLAFPPRAASVLQVQVQVIT